MFSLNSANSVTKKIFKKGSCTRTNYLLCEKQRLYHCTTETQLTEKTVKLILIHASVISQDSLKVLLHLGKPRLKWVNPESLSQTLLPAF